MGGLVGYGAYVPYYQLERTRIAGVLGSGGGSGTRSVAAFDEDTTSMAVAAGRAALAGMTGPGGQPGRPVSASHLGQRLKHLGIQPGRGELW